MSIRKYLLFVLVTIIVCLTWVGLEYSLDGKVISQHSDGIFALLSSYLIADKIDNFLKERPVQKDESLRW